MTIRIIQVKFFADRGADRTYAYYTDDDSVEVNDTVVVDAPSSGLTCAKVASTKETLDSVEKVGKWIVQKVDDSAYHIRLEKEERRKILMAKIRKAKEEALDTMALAEMSKISPELAAMVEELKGL